MRIELEKKYQELREKGNSLTEHKMKIKELESELETRTRSLETTRLEKQKLEQESDWERLYRECYQDK